MVGLAAARLRLRKNDSTTIATHEGSKEAV
jgi:hypothetical protein